MQIQAQYPQHVEEETEASLPRKSRHGSAKGYRRVFRKKPRFQAPCSAWSRSGRKRVFDFFAASAILLLFAPFLVLIALVVRLTSPGPAIFRQRRVGMHGEEFTIYKFRTMQHAAEGSMRSSHADRRLTPPAKWLRKYKLDELPQLWNVCRGDMSLVGPRPKLHAHKTMDTCFRPGLTGAATLAFAAEEHLLRNVHHDHLEETHRRLINPRKLELDFTYMALATFRSDLRLMWKTLMRADRYTELEQLGELPAHHTAPAHPAPDRVHPEAVARPAQGRGFGSVSL